MGYACPVCGAPQADGEHLANHLAFTAMLRGGEHADWLDEYAPDWADRRPGDLSGVITEHAVETEYDAVFEDTTGHDHPTFEERVARDAGPGRTAPDEETRRALEEARELTERMRGEREE